MSLPDLLPALRPVLAEFDRLGIVYYRRDPAQTRLVSQRGRNLGKAVAGYFRSNQTAAEPIGCKLRRRMG